MLEIVSKYLPLFIISSRGEHTQRVTWVAIKVTKKNCFPPEFVHDYIQVVQGLVINVSTARSIREVN